MVTFLTTALFLPQFYDIKFLFEGINFYLHLICPLFAFISLLVETQEEITSMSYVTKVIVDAQGIDVYAKDKPTVKLKLVLKL